MKCKYFKGLLKLNIKTSTALFVRVLSGFANKELNTLTFN